MAKGGMHGEKGHAWQRRGMCGERGGMHGERGHVWPRGACMEKGACMAKGGCMAKGHGRRDGHYSGRYTSYWNAFLLIIL